MNTFYWRQIFALDAVVIKTKLFSSHGGFLTNAVYHRREKNGNKLTRYDETEKMEHDSQIVRAKENLKLRYSGPSWHQPTDLKLYARATIESEA